MHEVPFYFDYACPWAYFGSSRAPRYFADLDVEFDYRPVRLRKLVEVPEGAENAPRPKLGPRKAADYQTSLLQWSKHCEAPISPDARKHIKTDTKLALCAALVAKDEGRFRAFHDRMYAARWAEAQDPSDPVVVGKLLAEAGLDADAALERARSDEIVERLEADTREAILRGVFGVPTLFVDDVMYWGNDRFELVRAALTRG